MEHFDLLKSVILPYANFLIFFGLGLYYFRKPLAAMVTKRREAFEQQARIASQAKDAAAARHRELLARVSRLDQEISEIKTFTKEAGDNEAAKVLAEGQRLALHLREEAQRIAEAEVERAREDLQQEIVKSVRESVEKKIKSDFPKDAQLKLVQNKIADLGKLRLETR